MSKTVEQTALAQSGPSPSGRTAGRRRPVAAPDATEAAEKRARSRRRIFLLFVACLLIPGSFFLAGARFTPYRMFLLLAFVPLAFRFLRGGAGRLTSVDLLALLYVGWLGLSMFVHEGMARIDFITIQVVEAFCGYLVGRVLVRNGADYRVLFRCFLWGLLVLAPFAALEMLTKVNLVSQITGMVLQPFGQALHPPRLGLHRAQVSFEHPILFGLFCSLGFANAFYIFRQEKMRRFFWMGVTFFTTFASLSSAPLLALMMQTVMMLWDRVVKSARSKWFILAGIGALIFLVLELFTPNGAVDFLVSNLTLVPATAEYRILTLQYSMETLLNNMAFGVGQAGEVDLPWWHTGSIDNFWLSTAVSYGLPTAGFLICTIVWHLWRVMMAPDLDEATSDLRAGHFIAVAGLIFTLTTVHLWGAASVMVMAYLGAGAWIYAPEPEEATRRLRRHDPGRARAPAPKDEGEAALSAPHAPAPKHVRPPRPSSAGNRARVSGSTARYGGERR